MLKVKDDLGKDALIVSVKNIKPKGIYKIFKKPYVEVTAALDDAPRKNERTENPVVEQEQPIKPIFNPNSEKKNLMQDEAFIKLLHDLSDSGVDSRHQTPGVQKQDSDSTRQDTTVDMPFLKIIYEQLLEHDVDEHVINKLMEGLGTDKDQTEHQLGDMISIVYKRIVKQLGEVESIKLLQDKSKNVVFVGPTGVGKTTTIAKIASSFTLIQGKNVALISADTYRIAAVEQLRTYANILNIPMKVVYSPDEMRTAIDAFKDKDLILIDTAGRSSKNAVQHQELTQLLSEIDNKEIYLVLNLGTKYKDLVQIIETYEDVVPYRLLFTKQDETTEVGSILNLKFKTEAALSYITFGQNVPDDISEINVHEIAKKILGGGI